MNHLNTFEKFKMEMRAKIGMGGQTVGDID